MGTYNPNAPRIIGQEFVPIKEVDLLFNETVNAFEQGHGFSLASAAQVSAGRFYVNERPKGYAANQGYTMTVYEAAKAGTAGPVKRALIPANNGGVTGTNVSILTPDTTVAQALSNPAGATNRGIQLISGLSAAATINIYFDVNRYASTLAGKRILGVNFLYSYRRSDQGQDVAPGLITEVDFHLTQLGFEWELPGLFLNESSPPPLARLFVRTRIGETAPYYGNAPSTNSNVIPWTYEELQKFEFTHANRVATEIQTDAHAGAGPRLIISYFALEVFYCEENRSLFGTTIYTSNMCTVTTEIPIVLGANIIQLRSPTNQTLSNHVLAPGDYVVTVNQANFGDELSARSFVGPTAELNALRTLEALPAHPGVILRIPNPLDESIIGKTITREETLVLPQLSLHTSGAALPLMEVHSYGRQAVAQVYGSVTATQEIQDGLAGGSHTWPWVRYYARRWGDTTIPLKLTVASQSVDLTVDEFDSLDEVLDGWKEVTLQFPTPPTMGAGTIPQAVWSSTGETVFNRWEVLGATAPAISGQVGNWYNTIGGSSSLPIATYGQPASGSTINLGWLPQYAPPVTAASDDSTSDATILLSLEPPEVTGFIGSVACMAISGIGQHCDLDPCCVPTDIYYNTMSWGAGMQGIQDLFERTEALGFNYSTSGHLWSVASGSADEFTVDGGIGFIQTDTGNTTARTAVLPLTYTNLSLYADVRFDETASGGAFNADILFRYTNTSNYYRLRLTYGTDGFLDVAITEVVAGVNTSLVSSNNIFVYDGVDVHTRIQATGTSLKAKIWKGPYEPTAWTLEITDASFASGLVGLQAQQSASNSNTNPTAEFFNFKVIDFVLTDTTIEIQRHDDVTDAWYTILNSEPYLARFNDFEARVGVVSTYRARIVYEPGFYGEWSDELELTIPEPGVAIGCLGDTGHVLIFTSNEDQCGNYNLAYSPVWDSGSKVTEDFAFPEANFVQLQPMYNKDFFTAFHPSERGGEQFTRALLVQAAAIASPTLADFQTLRDMAWNNVNYVCVRDDAGNRWFANVIVPSGTVQRNRRLYFASVSVREVTDIPTPLNLTDACLPVPDDSCFE